MSKVILHHPNLPNAGIFLKALNDQTISLSCAQNTTHDDVLNVIGIIGSSNLTHLAFVYHYPGYNEVPFFPDDYSLIDDEPYTQKYIFFPDNLVELFKKINELTNEPLIVDLLTCSLNNPEFKTCVEQVENDLGINIRYSLDQTGNEPEGNWVLESDGTDVKDVYFTDKINDWNDTLSNIIDFINEDGNVPADGTLLDSFKMYTSYVDFTNDTNSITPIRVTYNSNGGKTYTLEFTNTIDTDILTWGWVRLRKDGINNVTTAPSDSQQYNFVLGANDIFDGNSKTIRYRRGDNIGWTIESPYTGWDATSGAGETGNYSTRIYVWGLFTFPNTGINASNRAIVKNLSVDHGRGIHNGAGGLVQKRQDFFELYNCSSSCNFVNSNGGGLAGEWCGRAANGNGASGIAGDILINKCTYSGVMNKASCGGFLGKGAGGYASNSKILVINSSFEGRMGNISYGGAIFGTHLMSGEAPTYINRLCVISNCNIKFIHNNANIASRFNGLIGEYAGNSAAIVITNIAFEMEWTYQMSGSFSASALRNIIISNSYSNLITSDTTNRNEDIPLFAANSVSNSAYILNTYSNQLSEQNNGGLNADGTKKVCGDYDILDTNLNKSTMLNSYESINNFTMSGSGYTWNITSSSSAFTSDSPNFPTVDLNAIITASLVNTTVSVNIIPGTGGGGEGDDNNPPVAHDIDISGNEDVPITIDLSWSDVEIIDVKDLSFVIFTDLPANTGTLTEPSGNQVTYTPNAEFTGDASFSYYMFETENVDISSNIATVNIQVLQVNNPPVAHDIDVSGIEDVPIIIDLSWSDVEIIDVNDLSFVIVSNSGPSYGTLQGLSGNQVTYIPAQDFNGDVSFSYYMFETENDDISSNIATVNIQVLSVNDSPVAHDISVSGNEDVPITIDLSWSDVEIIDVKDLSFVIFTDLPANTGTLTEPSGNQVTYIPAQDFNGDVSFSYYMFETENVDISSNIATVNIHVLYTEETEAINAGVPVDYVTTITATSIASDGETIAIPATSISSGSAGPNRRLRRVAVTKLLFAANPLIAKFILPRTSLALSESYSQKPKVKVFKPNETIVIGTDMDVYTSWYCPFGHGEHVNIIPTTGDEFIISKSNLVYTIAGTTLSVTEVVSSELGVVNGSLTGFVDGDTCTVNGEPVVFGSVASGISGSVTAYNISTTCVYDSSINGIDFSFSSMNDIISVDISGSAIFGTASINYDSDFSFNYIRDPDSGLAQDTFTYYGIDVSDNITNTADVTIDISMINYKPDVLTLIDIIDVTETTNILLVKTDDDDISGNERPTYLIYRLIDPSGSIDVISYDGSYGSVSITDMLFSNSSDQQQQITYTSTSVGEEVIKLHIWRLEGAIDTSGASVAANCDISSSILTITINLEDVPRVKFQYEDYADYQLRGLSDKRYKLAFDKYYEYINSSGTPEQQATIMLDGLYAAQGSLKSYKYNQLAKKIFQLLVIKAIPIRDNLSALDEFLKSL